VVSRLVWFILLLISSIETSTTTQAFAPTFLLQNPSLRQRTPTTSSSIALSAYSSVYNKGRSYRSGNSRGGSGRGGDDKSKRQERVAQLVQAELSKIIHSGLIKGHDVEYLDDSLRQRIAVVNTDISPDLRQARISVSIRADSSSSRNGSSSRNTMVSAGIDEHDDGDIGDDDEKEEEGMPVAFSNSPALDKRRAYTWLVRNTKTIRHTLAQKLSHMKTCPTLSFVQVDVAAAVDVMYLIDKIAEGGYKRESLDLFDGGEYDVATGIVGGMDFDEDLDDDDDWEEADDDFFKPKK
jgi:ribosome-binding factor A